MFSVICIRHSQVCLLLSTITHYKKGGGTQPPREHPTSGSHDRDSMGENGLAHPHQLFIVLPYRVEVSNQPWEWGREDTGPPPEYLGAEHDRLLMAKTNPARIISASRNCVQYLLQKRHIILYCIVSHRIVSYCIVLHDLSFSMYVYLVLYLYTYYQHILILLCMLVMHGHPVHYCTVFYLLSLLWLFVLPIYMKASLLRSSWTSLSLFLTLPHPSFVSLVIHHN